MPDDYEHDVFFSYKRHHLTSDWTRQVHGHVQLWLGEELNRPARIFFDDRTIEVGDRWPDKLREGLKSSRCMVCVWSPLYFQSSWCISEWKSFLERERALNLPSHGLIAPLKFHDGEHFPPEAREVQWCDVEPYNSVLPVFWNTARALNLEDRLKHFARSVAAIVRNAPPFDARWPVLEEQGRPAPKIELRRL